MLEFDQKPVPAPLVAALQDALDAVPVKLLFEFSRGQPALMKGLSPRPDSAPALRRRLKSALAAARRLDDDWLELLREYSLQGRFLVVLSEKAVETAFADLAAFLGEPAFLAGLLLDAREPLRARAWRHLEAHPEADAFRDRDPAEARSALESAFTPFLELLAPLHAHVEHGRPAADPEELVRLREEVRTTRDRLRQIERKAGKETGALTRERETEKKRAAELDARLAEARSKLADSEARARAVERGLEELRGDLDRRLREGVRAELAAESSRWLLPLRALENAARNRQAPAQLLAEVRDTLKQQAEHDRAAGDRRELRKRLDAFVQARREVQEARRESLHPLPRLAPLDEALATEIEGLRRRLGEPAPANESENALLIRLNQATDPADLQPLRDLLDGPARALGLFPPATLAALRERLEAKRHELLQRLIPASGAPRPDAPGRDLLREKLALPAVRYCLFVDGHNFLLNQPVGAPGGEGADAWARDTLARRLAAALAGSRDGAVRLYFDGPERAETDLAPDFKIIYSGGGQGEDRADDAIVQDLAFYAPRFEGCFVVSDDAGLQARAARPGVHARRQNQLADLLAAVRVP